MSVPGSLYQNTIRKTRGLHWHNQKIDNIEQSMWFDGSSQHLTRSTSSHSSTEVVMACWFKLTTNSTGNIGIMGLGTGTSGSTNAGLWLSASTMYLYANGQGSYTNHLFRDPGWYHIIGSWKLDESIGRHKGRLFINGEEVISWADDRRHNWGTSFGSTATQSVGSIFTNTYMKGYIAQPIMLDGQSIQGGDVTVSDFLDTWAFGDNGSQYVPKKSSDVAALASTAGDNSFCLDFSNTSAFGNDISSNNNDLSDQGSPGAANQSGNTPSHEFATLNPFDGDATAVASLGYGGKLAEGVSDWDSIFATKSMGSSGKYYYETRIHTETASNGFPSGIHDATSTGIDHDSFIGNTTSTYGLGYSLYSTGSGSGYYTNGSPTGITGYSSALSAGDIISTAVDLDNNKIWWGLNGTYFDSGNPSTNTGGIAIQADTEYTFGVSPSASEDYFVNFGDDSTFGGAITANTNSDTNGVGAFKYAVPTNFQCLTTKTLSGPDYQGADYFDATIYEGNGAGQKIGDFVPFTDAYNVSNSVIFNDDDTAYLNKTPSGAGNTKTWTVSFWWKIGKITTGSVKDTLFSARSANPYLFLQTNDNSPVGSLVFAQYNGSGYDFNLITNRIFMDTSAWHHIVIAVDTTQGTDSNRIKIYVDGVQETSFSTETYPSQDLVTYWNTTYEQRIGFDFGSRPLDGYLAQVVNIDGTQLTPSSFGQTDTSTNRWIPKDVSGLTFGTNGFYLDMVNTPSRQTSITATNTGTSFTSFNASQTVDNDSSTKAFRLENATTGQQLDMDMGSGNTLRLKQVGMYMDNGGGNGQAATWSVFYSDNGSDWTDTNEDLVYTDNGESSNTEVRKSLTADHGTHRYWRLTVSATTVPSSPTSGYIYGVNLYAGGAGMDASSNNNHFAENSFDDADTQTDSPSNNKAVLDASTTGGTISEGGLKIVGTSGAYQWGISTLPIPKSGKWVFEAQSSNIDGSSRWGYVGIAQRGGVAGGTNTGNNYLYALNLGNGEVVRNSSVVVDIGAGATTSVMRVEYDADNDEIKIYDDNSLVHTGTPELTGHSSLHFVVAPYASGTDFTVKFTDFTHTPTTGYNALTQDNLDGTDDKITAWAWIKNRDATDGHILVDRIRGTGNVIHSDDPPVQTAEPNTVQRFLQRGVQIGNDVQVNTASESYVLWQWLLGTSASTGTTTSPAGTIASTSIVAAADHFSIVQYEGTKSNGTVGHGLSGAPEMIIIKDIDAVESWVVGHHTLGFTKNLFLNLNYAEQTSATIWQDTDPTSSVFTIGTSDGVNKTDTHIAYCFRSIPGVCKVGSYVGNGSSSQGPYVHLGFKPRWIMLKNSSVARDWVIVDTARTTTNPAELFLFPNVTNAEAANGPASGSTYDIDILSNGFRPLTGDSAPNGDGNTILYMAMAEIGGNAAYPPIYGTFRNHTQ